MAVESKSAMVYILFSSQLHGTERSALAALIALREDYRPILLAPPGPIHEESAKERVESCVIANRRNLVHTIRGILGQHQDVVLLTTSITQSIICTPLQVLHRGRVIHLHKVHGANDDYSSYGRKWLLRPFPIHFVPVSEYAAQRLVARHVPWDRITVIENCVPDHWQKRFTVRLPFDRDGIRRVALVSRLDPVKRVDLLLDVLDREPAIRSLDFGIYGGGPEAGELQKRVSAHANVHLHGFSPAIAQELAQYDLLLHLCSREALPRIVLEASVAGVPVLVPDEGGTGLMVRDGESGFHFRADDVDDLARRLRCLMDASADSLNAVVAGSRKAVQTRFSQASHRRQMLALIQMLISSRGWS